MQQNLSPAKSYKQGLRAHVLKMIMMSSVAIGTIAQASPAFAHQAANDPAGTSIPPLQGSPQNAGADMTEIVVTAQKRQQSIAEVAQSITAISGQTLQDRGVVNVQDLVKLTPGLSYVESGASTPVYSLRGIGFFDTALAARPTVGVYVDEVSQPFSAMTVGSAFDLERVEVLKGPQGTLFGQNSTGGAINYIAAKPTRDFKAGIVASYASFDSVDVEAHVSGPVAENLAFRLAARVQRAGDWQRSMSRDDMLGRRNFSQARMLADWKPAPDVRIQVNLNGWIDRSDTQASQFLAAVPANPVTAPTYIPALLNYSAPARNNRAGDWDDGVDFDRDNHYYQGSVRADIDISDTVKLTSLSSYQHMRLEQLTDQDGTFYPNSLTLQDGRISTYSQELRLAGEATHIRWLVGGNYEFDKTEERNVFSNPYNTIANAFRPFGIVAALRQNVDQKFNTYAAFGNLEYDITDTLTLNGGIRYTKADLSFDACSADFNGTGVAGLGGLYAVLRRRAGLAPLPALAPNGCITLNSRLEPISVAGELNEDNVSWRAGVEWKPRRGQLLYANVSRGYKAGSLPVVLALSTDQIAPASQESVLAYEVGVKSALLDRALDVVAAAFYYDYSDKQLKGRILASPNIFGPQEALINVPKSRVSGFEAQINARPFRGLNFSLGGTYISTRVQSDLNNFTILGSATNYRGQRFPYTPKYQLVGDVDYTWEVSSQLSAFAGVNMNYRSSTTAGFGTESVLLIDAYTTLDLRLGLSSGDGRWRLTLFGQNITDKYYWTNVAKIGDVARRLAGQPRSYGVRLSRQM